MSHVGQLREPSGENPKLTELFIFTPDQRVAKLKAMIIVKLFKSKNRYKIDLDAPNPNLTKGSDRDFRATD